MALKDWFRRTKASDPDPESAAATAETGAAGAAESASEEIGAPGEVAALEPALQPAEPDAAPAPVDADAGLELAPDAAEALERALAADDAADAQAATAPSVAPSTADDPVLEPSKADAAPEPLALELPPENGAAPLDPADRRTQVMPTLEDRRDEARIRRYAWARFESEEREGEGLVTNLSEVGAMVERASLLPEVGAKLELRLKIAGGFRTVDIDAEVIRHAGDGFAIRFLAMDDGARELVAEAVASHG